MAKPKAKRSYKIAVTADDILAATRSDSTSCAIATALRREIPGLTSVSVDIQRIVLRFSDSEVQFLTGRAAQIYIVTYDAGGDLEPFVLNLRDPIRYKVTKRTPAGRKIENARQNVRRARKAGAPPEEIEQLEQKAAAVQAELAGEKQTRTTGEPGAVAERRKPPAPRQPGAPRVGRPSTERVYGALKLPINSGGETRDWMIGSHLPE
jgi:hypothetical protein